jgi:polysaccharide pyruvyl transferase WcaK-like protein
MKKVSIIGALWTDNFGDILLADLYTKPLLEDVELEVTFPNVGEKVANELEVKQGSFMDFVKSDCLFFIGGGYLSEPPGNKTKWALSRFKLIFVYGILARLFGKKYIILGVGAGPIKKKLSSIIIRTFCNGAKKIVVRDNYSYETLKKIGVKRDILVSFDYALKLKETYIPKETRNTRNIALHLTSKQPELNRNLIDYLLKSNAYEDVWFIEDHTGEYEKVKSTNPEIEKLINDKCILYNGYLEMVDTIDSFRFVLTSKLHVGILGAIFEKKICSFPYHDKVKQFYKEIEFSDNCFISTVNEKAIIDHFNYCIKASNVVISKPIYRKLEIIDEGINQIKEKK